MRLIHTKHKITYLRVILVALTVTLAGGSALAEKKTTPEKTNETVVDSVVASVNGKPLTFIEISSRLKSKRALNFREAASDSEFRQVLDAAILEQVVQDEAQNRKIGVSDDEISNFLAEVATRNGLSTDGFKQALQAEGTDFESYKKQVRVEILKSKLGAAVLQGGIAISKSELDQYLNQDPLAHNSGNKIRLRQIFVAKAEKQASAAKEKVEAAYAQLKDGEEFADIAKQYSESPDAAEGGLLGEVTENELNPSIYQAVSTLEADQFSPIIENEEGFQVFYVEKRLDSEPDLARQSERELEARRVLESQKLQDKMRNYFSVEILKNHSIDKKI